MTKLIWTLLLTAILGESLHAGAFTETHYIYCGSILELGPVGYPNWSPAYIVRPPEHGDLYLFTSEPFPDSLVYKSDYGYLGVDTFVVACARATQVTCDTGIYIINVIGCPPISAFTETHDISCDSTLLVPGLGYPFWVRPEIIQAPANGQALILNNSTLGLDTLKYTPPPGFSGADTIIVDCAHATQVTCETGIYVVNVSCINRVKENSYRLELRLYPNPAREFLRLECAVPIEKVVVATAAGVPVRLIRPDYSTRMVEASLEGLPAGWYIAEAWSGEASGRTGFVIAR